MKLSNEPEAQNLVQLQPAPYSPEDAKQEAKDFASTPASGYRVPQIRERGLSAIHQVCGQVDDKGDAVHCDRLQDDAPC